MVRAGLRGREETMLGALEVPLLEQGAIQFIIMTVMIVVVAFLVWITIAK